MGNICTHCLWELKAPIQQKAQQPLQLVAVGPQKLNRPAGLCSCSRCLWFGGEREAVRRSLIWGIRWKEWSSSGIRALRAGRGAAHFSPRSLHVPPVPAYELPSKSLEGTALLQPGSDKTFPEISGSLSTDISGFWMGPLGCCGLTAPVLRWARCKERCIRLPRCQPWPACSRGEGVSKRGKGLLEGSWICLLFVSCVDAGWMVWGLI